MFGEVPDNDALMNPNIVSEELMFELERDFQYGWGSIWPYLSPLQTSYTAAKGVLEELKDVEDPMFTIFKTWIYMNVIGELKLKGISGRLYR